MELANSLTTSANPTSAQQPTLLQVVELRVGRPLLPIEIELLSHLSAEGVAKVNTDALCGIAINQTLKELTLVYTHAQERRRSLEQKLSAEAKELLEWMDRPATTDEIALFVSTPLAWIKSALARALKEGADLTTLIEDLAYHFKYTQLRVDAKALGEAQQMPVSLNHLAPTTCPESVHFESPNVAVVGGDRIYIGLSPILTWFTDSPASTIPCESPPASPTHRLSGPAQNPQAESSSLVSSRLEVSLDTTQTQNDVSTANPITAPPTSQQRQPRTRTVSFCLPSENKDSTHAESPSSVILAQRVVSRWIRL